MDKTKKFHILPKTNVISKYFPNQKTKVKEWFNFSLKSGNEIFKERKISWKNILIHDLNNQNIELINAYNIVESETTELEQNWTGDRLNEMIESSKTFHAIEKIDKDFFYYLIEKTSLFNGIVSLKRIDEYSWRHIVPDSNSIGLSKYLAAKSKIDIVKDAEYEKYSENLINIKKMLNKSKFIYLIKKENLLTSEPLQLKHLDFKMGQISCYILQCHPQYFVILPLSNTIIPELVNPSESLKDLIFDIFYLQLDILYLMKKFGNPEDNFDKWTNFISNHIDSIKPNFIYANDEDYKRLNMEWYKNRNLKNPKSILKVSFAGKMKLSSIINSVLSIDDILNFVNDRDDLIEPVPQILIEEEGSAYIEDVKKKSCNALPAYSIGFKQNGEKQYVIKYLSDIEKNSINYGLFKLNNDSLYVDNNEFKVIKFKSMNSVEDKEI